MWLSDVASLEEPYYCLLNVKENFCKERSSVEDKNRGSFYTPSRRLLARFPLERGIKIFRYKMQAIKHPARGPVNRSLRKVKVRPLVAAPTALISINPSMRSHFVVDTEWKFF